MTKAKIPKVAAPMDFGIEYLASPSHGNLKFLFLEEEELLANSAIMSFNSPVIKKMTVEDGRTTVDVQEFSKDAVQCFLKASYTGSLGTLSPELFRDVNKIAHVFEVTWLVARCFECFEWMVEVVHETDFTSQLYVFDEAMFILDQLKNKNYLDLVMKKFNSQPTLTESFVTNYLKDISQCSERIMDVIMDLTNNQDHILVKVLLNNLKMDNSSLHPNSRRILERLDLKNHSSAHESRFNELLEMLEDIENPSKEDYRLIMRILRRSSLKVKPIEKKHHSQYQVPLPNLFLEFNFNQFKDTKSLNELATFLITSPQVTSSLLFRDAMETWIVEKYRSARASTLVPTASISRFVEIFEEHMMRRKWKPLPEDYIMVKYYTSPDLRNLKDKMLGSKILTSNMGYHRVTSTLDYTPEELFSVDHDIKFRLTESSANNCKSAGYCGFILRVKAATGNYDDSFDIKFVTDLNAYGEDIHFHKFSLEIDNIHFALVITREDGICISNQPVSWYNRPLRDRTGNFWCWGPYLFFNEGEGQLPVREHFPIRRGFFCGNNARIRPIVYYS